MTTERPCFIVAFDCGEAWIVRDVTRAEAAEIKDDLGCLPIGVYGPDEVYLTRDPWVKNGYLRCTFVRRDGGAVWGQGKYQGKEQPL